MDNGAIAHGSIQQFAGLFQGQGGKGMGTSRALENERKNITQRIAKMGGSVRAQDWSTPHLRELEANMNKAICFDRLEHGRTRGKEGAMDGS